MRRVFLLYFLWIVCLITPGLGRAERPWGALNEYVNDEHYRYAMDFLIFNPTIFYNVSDEITPEQEAIFVQGVQKWPKEVLRIIREQKLESKFSDIVPILERPLTLKKRANKPDIIFSLANPGYCGDGAAGCLVMAHDLGQPMQIFLVKGRNSNFSEVILHEIGHFYGLSDQYERARNNSNAEYSSDINEHEKSIMHGNSGPGRITCDDADGFINLIDIRMSQVGQKQLSKRSKNGWLSLCPSSANLYQNGRTLNRKPTDLLRSGLSGYDTLRTYNKGQVEANFLVELPDRALLFDTNKGQVARDPRTNLITSIKTPLQVMVEESKFNSKATVYGETNRQVFWTRTFQYQQKTTDTDGTTVQPIIITEYIDNIQTEQYKIKVRKDGDLRGAAPATIFAERYIATATRPSRRVVLGLEHRTAKRFLVEQLQTDKPDKLEGSPADTVFHASIGGRSFACSANDFNQNPCKQLAGYYGTYQAHLRNIKSFYQNFYDPFFSLEVDAKTKRKIERDIKDNFKRSAQKANATTPSRQKNSAAQKKSTAKTGGSNRKPLATATGKKSGNSKKRAVVSL